MKATILYYSHKGRTAEYARNMAMYLWSKGLNVSLSSISDFDKSKLSQTDLLLLGCWTCGLLVIGQHPHHCWKNFCRSITGKVSEEKLLFFTTYKIRTGSLFRKMQLAMGLPKHASVARLKSRTGLLTQEDKQVLDLFVGNLTN